MERAPNKPAAPASGAMVPGPAEAPAPARTLADLDEDAWRTLVDRVYEENPWPVRLATLAGAGGLGWWAWYTQGFVVYAAALLTITVASRVRTRRQLVRLCAEVDVDGSEAGRLRSLLREEARKLRGKRGDTKRAALARALHARGSR